MKSRDGDQSNDSPKKTKGRSKKQKQSTGFITKSCWPKVIVSRDNRICKRAEKCPEATSLCFEGSSSKISSIEQGDTVEQLYSEENRKNFEEHGVCLISSSSEIQADSDTHRTSIENETSLKNFAEIQEDNVGYSIVEEDGNREKPIFVDLTTDEKNNWKQTISNRSENVGLEPRIMIADSSSKLNCTGSSSLATALRDRGPYLIPVQPNPSLPIRPAPLVPTRSFRKDCSPLLVLSKPATLDIVEVESVKSVNEDVEKDNRENQEATNVSCTSLDYVLPQISSVGSLSGIKRKITAESGIKENRRKKRTQEAGCCYDKDEHAECSIKEFLKNFCGSNESEARNSCDNKCAKTVEKETKEDNRNKLVPPLRLKKIVRAETDGCSNSQVSTDIEYESNYRIITGATPGPQSNSISVNRDDIIYEEDINSTNVSSMKTDSVKLKHRRNRLMHKLEELQSKALELGKQITSETSPQQNTWLKQTMNRYEKQIENLTKLHNKLSVALSASNEVTDMNDEEKKFIDDGCLYIDLQGENKESVKCNSSGSSPEPPKLSPRSPINYENTLSEDLRNSPPVLPRVCLTTSSNSDSVDKDIEDTQWKIWPISENSIKSMYQDDVCVVDTSQNLRECSQASPREQQDDININDGSDLGVSGNSLDQSNEMVQFIGSNDCDREKRGNSESECTIVQNTEKVDYLEVSETGPVISSVVSRVDMPENFRDDEVFKSIPCEPLSSSKEHVPQSDYEKVNKVTSSSNPLSQVNSIGPTESNQENTASERLQRSSKEEISTDSIQKSNHLISEQFPTLGNWLARISKKQAPKSKLKSQATGNVSFTPPNNATCTPGCEMQKTIGPTITNNTMNSNPQCGTERWSYNNHYQQQRQQQLLQHVASVTLSQPVPAVPPLRSAVCSPIPMTQFYFNNYAIDPYNNYPTIWPYGAYPYQSRLHPSSLSGYHFPMQETLRPLQHVDKRFPTVQEPIVRYPPPATANLDMRGNSAVNNAGGRLSSLFLPSPSLSSTQQTLQRASLTGYPVNEQFSQNRMFPDVVAAAAAAAVVAAASFDRQRETVPALSNAGIANIINGDSSHLPGPSRVINRDISNQTQDSNFSEGHENSTKYQQVQNYLFDRLALVKTADNFAQTNSVIGGDAQAPYRMTLVGTQPPKNLSSIEFRNCETPHLGKVNHSSISLHNLTCSNCGVRGPKFQCLGCKMAYYCNELCQENHWNVHVQSCPKKMPKLKKVT